MILVLNIIGSIQNGMQCKLRLNANFFIFPIPHPSQIGNSSYRQGQSYNWDAFEACSFGVLQKKTAVRYPPPFLEYTVEKWVFPISLKTHVEIDSL